MQHLLSSFRSQFAALLCLSTLSVITISGAAQDITPGMNQSGPDIPSHLLYQFKNDSDEIIAEGQFVKLDGSTVTIKMANHMFDTIKLSNVNEEGKQWVKKQDALQKKHLIKAQDARDIVLAINKTQPRSIIKGCSKLRPLGRAASGVLDNIKGLMSTRDPKAKLACLTVYPQICPLDLDSLQYLTVMINQNRHDTYDLAMDKPEKFLQSVAAMDYLGLLYLRHVAFNCNLKTEPDWISFIDKPIELKLASGSKNQLRRAAILAMGEIESAEAVESLIELAPIIEAPINGKQDHEMIAGLIGSLGKIGIRNDDVLAVIKRHEKNFPKETAKALERLKND